MQSAPRLVLAASRRSWERLRGESGARALALSEDAALEEGRVRWIPLAASDLADPADGSDAAWSARFRAIAATPQAPLVLLWVASSRGEAPNFLRAMDELGDRMLHSLQGDRVPPRVAAVIYVAEAGLDESDAVALETVACAGRNLPKGAPLLPRGLREMLGRRGRPTYLMSVRTRVGADGQSWGVGEIWPVEVGRLLASMEDGELRQPGLRAWRSVRFNPTRSPFDRIELEAFRFAREAIGLPDTASAVVVEGQGRQLPVFEAPSSAVPTDRVPQHCKDSPVRPGARPELPSWWDLAAVSAEELAGERTDTFGSRTGKRSAWYRRFEERGDMFIEDRRARALESLEETVGPKAVQARAWHAIHDDPALPNWFASGQFYSGPERLTAERRDPLRRWSELNSAERRVIEHRSRAVVHARELDVARAHFVGLGWRFACAAAASIFIATVFASLFRVAGWRWVIAMSSAAAAGAIIASALVLWLEARAGRRGRDSVERTVRHSEAAVAEAFLSRMQAGAAGERDGRRRRWFQAAARTRDTASRLKAIADVAEIHALRRASADAPELPPSLRSYVSATTVESAEGALPVESLRQQLRDDPSRPFEAHRRAYHAWWSEALRVEDPLMTGAIRHRTFGPRLTQAISSIVDGFRRDLISLVERGGEGADALMGSDRAYDATLGPSGDLRLLGVQTERAKGRQHHRTVMVQAMLRRHAERARVDLAAHFGSAAAPQAFVSEVDRWGCLGLVVDEVAIGFRGGEAGMLCVDPERGVCVWEGIDRRGPLAEAGDAVT